MPHCRISPGGQSLRNRCPFLPKASSTLGLVSSPFLSPQWPFSVIYPTLSRIFSFTFALEHALDEFHMPLWVPIYLIFIIRYLDHAASLLPPFPNLLLAFQPIPSSIHSFHFLKLVLLKSTLTFNVTDPVEPPGLFLASAFTSI